MATLLELLHDLEEKRLACVEVVWSEAAGFGELCVISLFFSIKAGFRHEDLLGVVKLVEVHVLPDQLCDQEMLTTLEAVPGKLVLPVKSALSPVPWVFHIVLVVHYLENCTSYLSAKLAQDAV